MFKCAIAELREEVEDGAHLGLWAVGAILTQDPSNHLHKSIRNVGVLLEDFQVNLDCALSELFSLLGPLILTDRPDELVGQILSDLVASDLEETVHVANIPVLVRSELVSKV